MSEAEQDREATAARPLGGLTDQIAFDPADPKELPATPLLDTSGYRAALVAAKQTGTP